MMWYAKYDLCVAMSSHQQDHFLVRVSFSIPRPMLAAQCHHIEMDEERLCIERRNVDDLEHDAQEP